MTKDEALDTIKREIRSAQDKISYYTGYAGAADNRRDHAGERRGGG